LFRRISEPFLKKRRQIHAGGAAAVEETTNGAESRISAVKSASRNRKIELDSSYDKNLTELVEKSQEELKLKRAEWMRRMLALHESQAREIDDACAEGAGA
jgi:hypothetical protein